MDPSAALSSARKPHSFPSALSVSQYVIPDAHMWHREQDLMVDPVVAADGVTYERAAIEDWFGRSGDSPLMGASNVMSAARATVHLFSGSAATHDALINPDKDLDYAPFSVCLRRFAAYTGFLNPCRGAGMRLEHKGLIPNVALRDAIRRRYPQRFAAMP